MIMRMYNGLRNFLEFVIVESIQLTDVDAIRPNRSKQKYHIPASIAMIDGTEESFSISLIHISDPTRTDSIY